MRPNFASLSKVGSRQSAVGRRPLQVLLTAYCLLLTAATGCESMQRKFTRKPKHPQAPPTPVIHFQDYTQLITPMDRYRKHYVMFEYWNDGLIQALQFRPLNGKRLKLASAEALTELRTLHALLADDMAQRLAPLLEQRERLTRQLQQGMVSASDTDTIRRLLEEQARELHRSFYWRQLEGQLKPLDD